MNPCRCVALGAAFGRFAPETCAPCLERMVRRSYEERDYVEVDRERVTPYRDCAVPIETLSYPAAMAMVPRWASELVDALNGTTALGVVLLLASQEPQFRDAACTVARLAEGSVVLAVCELIEARGVPTDGTVVARNGRAVFLHAQQELAPWPVPQAEIAQGW